MAGGQGPVGAAGWWPGRLVSRPGGRIAVGVGCPLVRAGWVSVFGWIFGTHAGRSSPAGRCASPVGPGLDRPALGGAASRLVSHPTRAERGARRSIMNRWTGTGHLTKEPKFLETDNGTAICTLRIAVKRAGKQGQDGYFDVKCFEAQASACAQYLKAGREIAVDGRLLFDEFQTQDGSYASRIYIVAERVEFLASRKPSNGQASDEASTDQPATGEAREAHQAA